MQKKLKNSLESSNLMLIVYTNRRSITLNINDWKVIQMQNDLKYIKRNTTRKNAANWSLVVDVFLVLLAFVLDRIFEKNTIGNCIWIIIAISGVVIPFILFVIEIVKIKRTEKISLRVLNAKELVKIFDDEICYMVMSAESFADRLKNTKKIDSRKEALLFEFYYIESNYYLNKAVHLLLKMDNNLSGVLDENNFVENHITRERMINVISLIASIYEELMKYSDECQNSLIVHSVSLNLNSLWESYDSLKKFVYRKEDILYLDSSKIFGN